jgi:Replication-relaxation
VRALPASYLEAHRYDGAAIEHARRAAIVPCAIQPRDLTIVHDVWHYKFLTSPQLRELWWPRRSVQAADRRLLKLFRAGLIDRFRPVAKRGEGSHPWTYCLGDHGHRLLQRAGLIPAQHRYRRRAVYDYGHILHELQLNAWVIAYRRALNGSLLRWDGETPIDPPAGLHPGERLDDDYSAEGLKDPRARSVCPDAMLEIAGDDPDAPTRLVLVEYDRTRRLDKNYEKFKRYDTLLNSWWQHTHLAAHDAPPFVLFVCQDEPQRDLFLAAADRQLTGHRWHPDLEPDRHDYVGRQRILFAAELDAHAGRLVAHRLPAFPPGHRARQPGIRRVRTGPALARRLAA